MADKYVKDKAHNRYPAYCCDDIDERVGALEEAVAALVAGTIPDGTVTLAKLAEDARSWAREINKGTLVCEWIGTQAEYEAHLEENGGEPLANCRYTITDNGFELFALGSFLTARATEMDLTDAPFVIGWKYDLYIEATSYGEVTGDCAEIKEGDGLTKLDGKWRCCGECAIVSTSDNDYRYALFQRVE